jgi:uncharacterized protein YhhL (DUF1145 family)
MLLNCVNLCHSRVGHVFGHNFRTHWIMVVLIVFERFTKCVMCCEFALVVVCVCQLLSLFCDVLSVFVNVCELLLVVVHVCQLLSMFASVCHWLSMFVLCCCVCGINSGVICCLAGAPFWINVCQMTMCVNCC